MSDLVDFINMQKNLSDTKQNYSDGSQMILPWQTGGTDYKKMSNPDNWICVHVTKYLPQLNKDNKMFIQTTAMATDYKFPRSTVHTTLNHPVEPVFGYNDWETMRYIIFAPYKDIVAINGNPHCISLFDTYFIPNTDTGLILPPSTYIIKPSNDSFYTIGTHIATYKSDNFSDAEKNAILSVMSKYESELIDINNNNDFALAMRNFIFTMAMKHCGYYPLANAFESDMSDKIADIASTQNIYGVGSDKAHSGTLENELEHTCLQIQHTLKELYSYKDNIHDIFFKFFINSYPTDQLRQQIANSILIDQPFNFYQKYIDVFNEHLDLKKSCSAIVGKTINFNTIEEYSHELHRVIKRHSSKIQFEYNKWFDTLKANPNFDELKQNLITLVQQNNRTISSIEKIR